MRRIIFFIMLACLTNVQARVLDRELSMKGRWRFELGDNMAYADPDFDDSNWSRIYVPKNWEARGYPGYDGYAWYRVSVRIPKKLENKSLFFKAGFIDDVDEVYLNGKLLGSLGSFPPSYESAYTQERIYWMNHEMVKFGKKNVIAIRVYDQQGVGGIVRGNIGIYSSMQQPLIQNIEGSWKFSPGDSKTWASPDYDDSEWDDIQVPSAWEKCGYPYLDGFAWYRKKIHIDQSIQKLTPVLTLGTIDDMDEVYLNGVRIGSTSHGKRVNDYYNVWEIERYYFLPDNLVHWGGDNLIAVRVWDGQSRGGIYEGPIGLLSKENFNRIYRKQKENPELSPIKKLFDWIDSKEWEE